MEQVEGEAAKGCKGKLNGNGAKGQGKGKLQASPEQQVGDLGAKESGSQMQMRWSFVCQFNNVQPNT